ncbi:hypothetical protein Hanom_Chr16g01440011 [Helianthus anomalus]
MVEKVEMPRKIEVKIQTGSSELSNNDKINEESDNKTDEQSRKCVETCSACTEKVENLKSRNAEFTKIERVFKEKCKEMFENENILKQKDEELTQKCKVLEKENEILKQKCSANSEECLQKEIVVQEMKKNMM